MPIIDHRSKLVLGRALGESADTELALEAWRKANKTLRRLGQKIEKLIIHHDQDGVYTGHGWLSKVVVKDRARVSYSKERAKGNVHMESFIGRFKEENRLILWEQEDLRSLQKVVNERVRYYNFVRKHSHLEIIRR